MGYCKALAGIGISAHAKAIGEFDFSLDDYSGKTIILAHQLAVPLSYVAKLEAFFEKGGRLILIG